MHICFEVIVHQILLELLWFLMIFQTLTSFPDNASYSFHPIRLKHGGQLDYEVMQCIVFRGYSSRVHTRQEKVREFFFQD